jgi:hypothetical protein
MCLYLSDNCNRLAHCICDAFYDLEDNKFLLEKVKFRMKLDGSSWYRPHFYYEFVGYRLTTARWRVWALGFKMSFLIEE